MVTGKYLIEKIINRSALTKEEAYECMLEIGRQELNHAQIVAIMTGLQFRGLQLEELMGFRKALLELAIHIQLEYDEAIDVCGTGGDGKNTFNISTTSAFVLASMGYKVIKHGNYGVSSLCGSSNVLEHLGIRFTTDQSVLQRQLDKTNLCFLHAPLFHPALKVVAPMRKQLATTTFFNALGPLVNPVQPTHQVVGTYSLELAKLYQHVLADDRINFTVLHGLDGFDELTFIGATRLLGKSRDEIISSKLIDNELKISDLSGGQTVEKAGKIVFDLLNGKGSNAQQQVLAGNVALGLQTFQPELSLESAYEESLDFIRSGKGIVSFNGLMS